MDRDIFMGAFKSKQKYLRGFTLIEMLIVIAIIAVLAAVAIPSYQKYVERAKRADGKSYILDLASRQERFFSQYLSYTDVIVCAGGGIACGLGLADNSSVENNYTAGITLGPGGCAPGGVSCRTYTITVTPNFIDTDCNQLTYTNTGVEGENGTQDAFYCWR